MGFETEKNMKRLSVIREIIFTALTQKLYSQHSPRNYIHNTYPEIIFTTITQKLYSQHLSRKRNKDRNEGGYDQTQQHGQQGYRRTQMVSTQTYAE